MKQSAEWSNVTREKFNNDIMPLSEPAIFRGLVESWDIVEKSKESSRAVAQYLKESDVGVKTDTWFAQPEVKGKFFYQDSWEGYNFQSINETISQSIDRIFEHIDDVNPPSIYTAATLVSQSLPSLERALICPLLNESIPSIVWVGNRATVQTHYDNACNIACVVQGRRRFTLFPPSQVSNLYPGPIDFSPAATPISMVKLHDPDFEKYPRFRDALSAAQVVELNPGDALYLPPLWWHHVESLDSFNVLINYWWSGYQVLADSPLTCLAHGLMSIRSLPKADRLAWRAMFDHYVFEMSGDSVQHIPEAKRGMLGRLTPATYKKIKKYFFDLYHADQPRS